MAACRKLWAIIGIVPLLVLAACSPGFDAAQHGQAHLATTSRVTTTSSASAKATPTTVIQISVVSKPTPLAMEPTPIMKPSTPTPGKGNNAGLPTPTPQVQQLALYLFGLIYHDRVARGLPAYSWSNALAGGAHLHNLKMLAYGQIIQFHNRGC